VVLELDGLDDAIGVLGDEAEVEDADGAGVDELAELGDIAPWLAHDLDRDLGARLMADLTYEVSFKGVASGTLRAAFGGYELSVGTGRTLVRCSRDALRAVIARIEELGLELLEIRLVADWR
jgi:hypothetical protein